MELIDRKAVMAELGITEDCKDCQFADGAYFCMKSPDFTDACEAICSAPVIDAVQITRCRNCEHGTFLTKDQRVWCDVHRCVWNPEGYCSGGTPKT